MKVLGFSASSRRWGNTDILVHHALQGAQRQGADTRFLHLADLDLRFCTGCMSCVFKNRDCGIEDQLAVVLEHMRWADAVVFGSPTYMLGATALTKTLQERLLRFATVSRELAGKPGLAIAAAGVRGWEPFALPQISSLFFSLGMPVADQFVAYGQGPGEVFWDEEGLARASAGGAALARGETAYRGPSGTCPYCHFDLVSTGAGGRGHCMLCDVTGIWIWEGEIPRFQPEPGSQPRWSERRSREHFQQALLPSAGRFRSRVNEIRTRIAAMKTAVQA